jgi:hypothetical protein
VSTDDLAERQQALAAAVDEAEAVLADARDAADGARRARDEAGAAGRDAKSTAELIAAGLVPLTVRPAGSGPASARRAGPA